MHPLLRVSILALLIGSVGLMAQLAGPVDAQTGDPKAQPDTAKTAGDPKDTSPKKIPLDKFKMPAGGVVVLVDEMKGDVRNYFPRMVIMTPEKHQELMDRIAQLEKQVKVERKSPYACKVLATVVGETLRVKAELHFQVDQPRADVFVGFRGAQLTEAKIRGKLAKPESFWPQSNDGWQPANIDLGADGYVVQADQAGDYQMLIELRLPLASTAT